MMSMKQEEVNALDAENDEPETPAMDETSAIEA